jgi:hypothetical protein
VIAGIGGLAAVVGDGRGDLRNADGFEEDLSQMREGAKALGVDGLGVVEGVDEEFAQQLGDGLCDIVNEVQRVVRPTPFKTPDAVPSE